MRIKKRTIAGAKATSSTPVVTQNIARVLLLLGVKPAHYRVVPSRALASISIDAARQSLAETFDTNVVYSVASNGTVISTVSIDDTVNSKSEPPPAMRHLRTMSLFCGAGGFDIGLAARHAKEGRGRATIKSGHICTRWAIDACPAACKTFRGHHAEPDKTTILNVDVGTALQKRKELRGMPDASRKNVDVIVMGPPCQPFSRLNRSFRKSYDPRSLLIATGLSYVDIYRPAYGVIENVAGILYRGDLGNVPSTGVVTFIRAALLAVGYSVRFSEVQCQDFGIPQQRKRVIVIFARKGLMLPAAPRASRKCKAVTVADATSDLPRWEYSNPHQLYGREASLHETRPPALQPPQHRLTAAEGIDNGERTIGPARSKYVSPPQNDFQHRARASVGNMTTVTQHQTLALHDFCIERICNVPLKADGNHLSWLAGRDGLVRGLSDTTDDGAFSNAFGRLDMDGVFTTITTSISLASKTGRLLMPDQHRIPTFHELARVQGFPDDIVFRGPPAKIIEQIGNAVPPPLAEAIGLSIERAASHDWLHNGERRFARHAPSPNRID